ncbi:MAG: RNA recognition motif domain-containing protein [Victivallaceae bacterium]
MNIYVGNMAYSMTEHDLDTAFAAFGKVNSVRLATDRDTGRAKGFGFVEMEDDAEARAAIAGLNGKAFDGRELVVNEARPREERGGSGFNRPGFRR